MILSSSTSLIRGFSHCAICLLYKSSCLIVVIILRQAAVIPHVTCLVMGKSVARQVGKLYFNFYIIVTVQNKLQAQSITTSDTPSNGLKHCKTLHPIGIKRCPSVSVSSSLKSCLGFCFHFVLGDIL